MRFNPLRGIAQSPLRRALVAATAVALGTTMVVSVATSASAAAGCQVNYTISSQWPGGSSNNITITNLGDPLTTWTLTWTFGAAGQAVGSGWSGNWSQSGLDVSVTNLSWNSNLGTGASTGIGYNGAWTTSNPVPAQFKLNGTVCNGGVTPSGSASASASASPSASASASASASSSPGVKSIILTPTSLAVAEGGTGTVNVKLNAAPTANVTVALALTGDTSITVPASVTLTTANWSAGVNVTISAAEDTDQTNGTATIAATSTGYTSASVSVTEADNDTVGRVDNPYAGARGYVNPEWKAKATAEVGGSRIANTPTAVWVDRIAAIEGTEGSSSNGSMGVEDHLDAALAQYNAGTGPLTVQFVIYNLPGRDCSALASNGELGTGDLARYKAEYIDPIAAIQALPKFAPLRIINVVEIDSLPNLVTNTNVATCATMKANGGYVQGIGYALQKFGALGNTYNYIDAAHHGWIGWDSNFGPSAQIMYEAAVASGNVNNVHGFITNTANYSALVEPYFTINSTVNGTSVRQSKWVDWNFYVDELSFAQAFRTKLVQTGFNANIGMLIDTSRNGWGGSSRPTGPGAMTSVDTFVNGGRIDRRIHPGNWCNQAGAGLGERPTAAPATGIDAYVWVKPPGESDGSSSLIPNNEGKGFDRMCDPTYTGNERNGNSMSGALSGAPISGAWFSAQFQQLMANAYPPLP